MNASFEKQAEAAMTPEQKAVSATRERFKFQERPLFFDASVTEDGDSGIRRAPTSEDRTMMDSSIGKLGKVFAGSDVGWQLDGALNISLMKGEYIGVHKDVDLSIESSDLEKLDDQLGRNDYGLFLSSEHLTDSTKRQMERVGAEQFREAPEAHLMIAAIDEQGKIREGEAFNYIGVHLVKRDDTGAPLGHSGVQLPGRWYEPQLKMYQGEMINLSHPAKVAYYKLLGTRPFDVTDLQWLAAIGDLTTDDVDEIGQVFEREFALKRQMAEGFLKKIASNITSDMSADAIYDVFVNEPLVAEKMKRDVSVGIMLKELASTVSKTDRSPEIIQEHLFRIFNAEKAFDAQRTRVKNLRSWVTDAVKLKELRDVLDRNN